MACEMVAQTARSHSDRNHHASVCRRTWSERMKPQLLWDTISRTTSTVTPHLLNPLIRLFTLAHSSNTPLLYSSSAKQLDTSITMPMYPAKKVTLRTLESLITIRHPTLAALPSPAPFRGIIVELEQVGDVEIVEREMHFERCILFRWLMFACEVLVCIHRFWSCVVKLWTWRPWMFELSFSFIEEIKVEKAQMLWITSKPWLKKQLNTCVK